MLLPAGRAGGASRRAVRDAGPRARPGARRRADRSCARRRSSSRSRSRSSCRSATSTAPWARCSATRSRGGTAAADCPTTRSRIHFTGIGRSELRRVRAARHHADARRRRNDYCRQGPVGRQARRLSAARRRRSRRRRTSSSATSRSTARPAARPTSAASPASASPSATAARWRSSKASAITAAST